MSTSKLTPEEWLLFGQQIATVSYGLSIMCKDTLKTFGIMNYKTRILFNLKRHLTEITKILGDTVCNAYPFTYWYLPGTGILLTCVFHDSNVRYEYVNIDPYVLPLHIDLLSNEIEIRTIDIKCDKMDVLLGHVEKMRIEATRFKNELK